MKMKTISVCIDMFIPDKEGLRGGLTLGRQEIVGVVNDSQGERGFGFWKSI
jgi:hypothetical protein